MTDIEDETKVTTVDAEMSPIKSSIKASEVDVGELISYDDIDPALEAKMHLVNNAINQLGFTTYHWKLFCLSGFGSGLLSFSSQVAFLYSITVGQVVFEYQPSYIRGGQLAFYVGALVGALFWGISADIIGRKWAFNISLLLTSIFGIICGAADNWIGYCSLVCLTAFACGGNLVLDTTVFLEFLPSNRQWLVTLMAIWWGVGQTIAGLLAWAFIPNFSCASADNCTRSNNMGWRYLFFTAGGLVLVMSLLRVTVLRFEETPKFLVCQGRDEQVANLFQKLAKTYGRPIDLTLEDLQRHGQVTSTHSRKRASLSEIWVHYRGLFMTRKTGMSTTLVWFSWALIGLAYPLFYFFLPDYLASRGARFGETSAYITWRNYTLAQVCAIFGPLLAAYLCQFRRIGRKYTMLIGAMISMAFFFSYTAVRNNDENVAFNCVISFATNIYYGTLYAYSPEVMPSAHRSTGNGTAVACNRIMGIMSAVVATYASPSTAAPVYICAALFGVMGLVAVVFPFEPERAQSM